MPLTFKDQIISKFLSKDVIVDVTQQEPKSFLVVFVEGNWNVYKDTVHSFITYSKLSDIIHEIKVGE